ncbi:hypothetical protein ACIBEA_06785 [Streptomyces sp. NPDC051555]|uniref:hypothetical protein n=1 Tax=Streptomyces sp. NPDC051555 TaxID=3365657 RepID=UPI00378AFED3
MNGNPAFHALAMLAATLFLLPLPIAIFVGWTPPRLPDRATALPYAWAFLCLYALVFLNALPRMLDASATVVTLCTGAGPLFSLAAVACLVRSHWAARGATPPRTES